MLNVQYVWDVEQLECCPERNGLTDVVVRIFYSLTALAEINGEMQASQIASDVFVDVSESTVFTPYDSLSKEQVLLWVQSTLSEEVIQNLKNDLVSRFNVPLVADSVTRIPPWKTTETL